MVTLQEREQLLSDERGLVLLQQVPSVRNDVQLELPLHLRDASSAAVSAKSLAVTAALAGKCNGPQLGLQCIAVYWGAYGGVVHDSPPLCDCLGGANAARRDASLDEPVVQAVRLREH